jgi:hypothetical protein
LSKDITYWEQETLHITRINPGELEDIQENMYVILEKDFDTNRNLYYDYVIDIIDIYIEDYLGEE